MHASLIVMHSAHDRERRGQDSEAAQQPGDQPSCHGVRGERTAAGGVLQEPCLALSSLQRGLKRRRTEAEGQGESKRLVEVKIARSRSSGSAENSVLAVLLGKSRRIEVRRDFDAETLVRLIRTIEEI